MRTRLGGPLTMRGAFAAAAGAVILFTLQPAGHAQKRGVDFLHEPACQTLTPTSAGGPAPKDPNLMVLRYLGAANHELAYRDNVMLLDAYYTRTPPARPVGVTREDIKKATAIFIGHAHGDHYLDAPYIAEHTGAPIIGGPPTTEASKKANVPAKQIINVTGGEVLEYPGMAVEVALGHHSDRTPEFARSSGDAYKALQQATGIAQPPRADQEGAARAPRPAGTPSPENDIPAHGTMVYAFRFNNGGYTLIYHDSAGPITDGDRQLMAKLGGHSDMALVAYQGWYVPARQIEPTLPLVKLFNPTVFMPTHHDETGGSFPDIADEPLFMAIRDVMPKTRTIAPLYRTPVCVDVQTKEIYIGEPWAWLANQPKGSKSPQQP